MPIDLKIDFDSPTTGDIQFRRSFHHWEDGKEEEFVSIPTTGLVLKVVPNQIPEVNATFLVWTAEALAATAFLVDPAAITQYCFYCRAKLHRICSGDGVYYVCDCEGEE